MKIEMAVYQLVMCFSCQLVSIFLSLQIMPTVEITKSIHHKLTRFVLAADNREKLNCFCNFRYVTCTKFNKLAENHRGKNVDIYLDCEGISVCLEGKASVYVWKGKHQCMFGMESISVCLEGKASMYVWKGTHQCMFGRERINVCLEGRWCWVMITLLDDNFLLTHTFE